MAEFDEVIHQPLRLKIMAALNALPEGQGMDFPRLKKLTGATDGKYLRVKGIPVYGVSGMFGDVDDVRAHGKDERIAAKDFYDGIEFMYRFMKALSSEKIK